jgi:hypothetical protein
MTYKLRDLRNLRITWRGDWVGVHSASIMFESGDRRFHIWLVPSKAVAVEAIDEIAWKLSDTLYSSPIEPARYGGRQTRHLDLNATAHKALRDLVGLFVKQSFGDLNSAVRKLATNYIEARDLQRNRHAEDLAKNIREAVKSFADELQQTNINAWHGLAGFFSHASDEEVAKLRGAIYSAKYPDQREYDAEVSVNLKGDV